VSEQTRLVHDLVQQAGLSVSEDELPQLAGMYEDVQQLLDTIESVQLEAGEESALALDLFAWEGATEGPVVAREGDAP